MVRRGAALLYQITLDSDLTARVNPRAPARGQSAFQTDLCVFDAETPRVVLEFKAGLTTHDVLTYSAKARKHKQIYPFLRYGVVVGKESTVARRFFVHNEALDFCVALSGKRGQILARILSDLVQAEIRSSRRLQRMLSGQGEARLYRTDIHLSHSE